MSNSQTRIATPPDLGVIASLLDAYCQDPDLDLARRFIHARILDDESVVSLATSETQDVIGFCQLYPTFCSGEAKPTPKLYELFVSPHGRRAGAGKVLLQAAEKLAVARGKARTDLKTARTDKPDQAAYESLGWA